MCHSFTEQGCTDCANIYKNKHVKVICLFFFIGHVTIKLEQCIMLASPDIYFDGPF